MTPPISMRYAVPMALGIVAVFWCGWALVSPRNFGGYDEWLIGRIRKELPAATSADF